MSAAALLDIWQGALATLIHVGGPLLLASLVVGLVMSVIQAATQLQENVISFAPKVLAIGLVMGLGGAWLLQRMVRFFNEMALAVEQLGHSVGM